MTEITCAIVGLGRIGSSLETDPLREKPCTHAGAMIHNPDCRLVAGCDIKPEARQQFISQWSPDYSFEVFNSIDSMLKKLRPEILSIATPPNTHRELVQTAVRAQVPVVICEKPLAHSLRDARAIVRKHTSGQARILVNHERRYSRDYQAVREYVATQRYGALLSLHGTLYFGKSATHRDVLLHDGTHMIDIINYLIGTTCSLKKRYGSMRARTSSAFLFGQAGAVPVSIEIGSGRDHLLFELELSFECGRIRVGNGVLAFEESKPSPYYSDYRSLLLAEAPAIRYTDYFSGMLADAVKSLRDPHYKPLSSAEDSLEVMRFIRSVKALL